MNSIYRTFFKKHIDLDKLVAVSEASFLDRMGSGGYYVEFTMHFQLLENPITYSRSLNSSEYEYLRGENTRGSTHVIHRDDEGNYLCVNNLNKQIQEILDAWNEWKKFKGVHHTSPFSFTNN